MACVVSPDTACPSKFKLPKHSLSLCDSVHPKTGDESPHSGQSSELMFHSTLPTCTHADIVHPDQSPFFLCSQECTPPEFQSLRYKEEEVK